jgi:Ferritin-like domain
MSTRLPEKEGEAELRFLDRLARTAGRRTFLQWSGLTMAVVALGCSDDDDNGAGPSTEVNLGTGDTGVLNYAYALEQLEAAFYTAVTGSFYAGATAAEQSILNDIRAHEVIHRDFLKAALGTAAIADLEVDFTSVDLTSRTEVLGAAQIFEDLGVAAYNGAGKLLATPSNLVTAGRIVSVEARHAAAIRDLVTANSFAGSDVVDANGLDRALTPTEVLTQADPYVTTTINSSGLPTS